MNSVVLSPASDAVITATHPSPDAGGPCATCAFRPGTEANQTAHTVALARMCVEGLVPFYCHETPGLCLGFVAAANLKGAPSGPDEERWVAVNRAAADLFATMISSAAKAEQDAHDAASPPKVAQPNLRGSRVRFVCPMSGKIIEGYVITRIRGNLWQVSSSQLPKVWRRYDGSRRIVLDRGDLTVLEVGKKT